MENWIVTLVGLILTVIVSSVSLAWWLSKQFGTMRSLIYEKIEKLQTNILTKLEYHEKHDDARFDALSKDIWTIRLRNASKDRQLDRNNKDQNNQKNGQ